MAAPKIEDSRHPIRAADSSSARCTEAALEPGDWSSIWEVQPRAQKARSAIRESRWALTSTCTLHKHT